jgi:hypothetical protein
LPQICARKQIRTKFNDVAIMTTFKYEDEITRRKYKESNCELPLWS